MTISSCSQPSAGFGRAVALLGYHEYDLTCCVQKAFAWSHDLASPAAVGEFPRPAAQCSEFGLERGNAMIMLVVIGRDRQVASLRIRTMNDERWSLMEGQKEMRVKLISSPVRTCSSTSSAPSMPTEAQSGQARGISACSQACSQCPILKPGAWREGSLSVVGPRASTSGLHPRPCPCSPSQSSNDPPARSHLPCRSPRYRLSAVTDYCVRR